MCLTFFNVRLKNKLNFKKYIIYIRTTMPKKESKSKQSEKETNQIPVLALTDKQYKFELNIFIKKADTYVKLLEIFKNDEVKRNKIYVELMELLKNN